jgi:hypothetical protein
MAIEKNGKNVKCKKNKYEILRPSNVFLLKEITIQKRKLHYAFIGGMWYSKNKFSLESKISLPYPFSTYYVTKILDKKYDGKICRSLYYVKMPIIVLQFDKKCICIEFDPVIKIEGGEIIPFVSLREDEKHYTVSFYLFKEFYIKEKKYAWLGFGRKKKIVLDLKPGDVFDFSVKIKEHRDWKEAVREFIEKKIPDKINIKNAKNIFEKGKEALWRSYDHLTGSFLQLPWSKAPGFTFVNSSYSLLSFEAIRLYYFMKWYRETRDTDFLEWSLRLKNLFKNPRLIKKDLRRGEGIVWYNMTNLSKQGLEGFFYLDCGYGGYPGGQGTITFNLLRYLELNEDKDIEKLVKDGLEYILSTQNRNGSWPMAIHQEGLVRFRPENLEKYETYGGTAECVRALIQGYKRFKDKKMLDSAFKGLKYLEANYPICYHGLRDIGINEAEAFSAVSIIEAFLDAYEFKKDKKYLENALVYAYYTLTWFYLYDTIKLKLMFNFHPISESITPRLSPYESALIVSTYLRLHKLTKDTLWKKIAKLAFIETTRWISKNGGLCEGIFPRFLDKLESLPMEQTFATVELLKASSKFFKPYKKREDSNRKKINEKIKFVKNDKELSIIYDKEEILRFDVEKFKIVFLKGANLNEYGISFSFFDSYLRKNIIGVKKFLRGKYGKYILGIGEIKRFIKGVYPPKTFDRIEIDPFEKYEKKDCGIMISKNYVDIYCETDLHRIECKVNVFVEKEKICIHFDPVVVKVLNHDVPCKKILFPIIGAKLKEKKGNVLQFDGFAVEGDFKDTIEGNNITVVDQTLATNWTHGGIYRGKFRIEI